MIKANFRNQSGQAILEFATVVVLMTTLVFGLIDFGRAIYAQEVITNMTREGSKLASSGFDVGGTAAAIINQSDLPNFPTTGEVIVTSVENENGQYIITSQAVQGVGPGSKLGSTIGGIASNLPPSAQNVALNGLSIYVTEVYYAFKPVTPIGALLKLGGSGNPNLPAELYDIAYF